MRKIVRLNRQYWPGGGFGHWCPGCESGHEITVDNPNASGAKWTFNGDGQSPTFAPSINIKLNPKDHKHYQPNVASSVCHYFINAGMIQFCGDSTHALAGKTVPLPEIPARAYFTCEPVP